MPDFTQKHCIPCEGGVPKLTPAHASEFLGQVPGWELSADGIKISRTFTFKNFKVAMVFVNKVADIANEEDHHPDILINYSRVTLTLWTHAIGGLSENDFIIAAKASGLVPDHSR